MRRKLTTQFAFGVIAVAIMLTGSESCSASGDSWGGSFGSRGVAGGSWGSRGGFRTPVRNFFAYRQPVRSLLRGVGGMFAHRGGSYGSRGWSGAAGYGSAGYSYGSGGYNYGSVGGGSTGYSYYSNPYPYVSNGCVGSSSTYSSPSVYGYTGPVNYPTMSGCADCVSGGAVIASPTAPYSDGSVISTDSSVIPADQYYQQGTGVVPTESSESSEGSGVRGFETPPDPVPDDGDETTSIFRDSILNVSVPEDAKIYVNGRLTKTPGVLRQYVSRNLAAGKEHKFNLEAVAQRNGKQVSIKKQISMRAGRDSYVEFEFDQPVLTQLTLKVPENASVTLCGNETNATGSLRNFKTKMLPGKSWDNYDIAISYDLDGETVTDSRTLSIEAGEKYVLDFTNKMDYYTSK